MEYTITKLARLSGVTTRTLRYYDQIELLCPTRISNGYRIYGQPEIDRLQKILFYRDMGIELKQIRELLDDTSFDHAQALEQHLSTLLTEKIRLEQLIQNVTKTLDSMKGEVTMSDKEKFEGFKKQTIAENEEKYGEEIRAKYGEDTVDQSNARFQGMREDDFQKSEELRKGIESALADAFAEGNPSSELAQQACEMHKQWLCLFWPDGMYTKEAHMGLADMYVADERFRANYDKIGPGCTEFLRDAIHIFCEE